MPPPPSPASSSEVGVGSRGWRPAARLPPDAAALAGAAASQSPDRLASSPLPNQSRQVTRGYPPLLLHPCVRLDTFPSVAALYSAGSMRLSLSMPCCNY
nr:unnamed protein product [Digitaria exilis]